MCERMYLVVKSIINNANERQEYEIKKGDILKMGRTKLLVRDINIVKKNEKINRANEMITRRRNNYMKRLKR